MRTITKSDIFNKTLIKKHHLLLSPCCLQDPSEREGKGRRVGNFKYSEDLDYSDLVTAVRLGSP